MILQWKRAITILIISFLMLNIVLVVNLWFRGQPNHQFSLSASQKDQIIQSLRDKGVILEADIPNEGKSQPILEIGLPKLDENRILQNFFGKGNKPSLSRTPDGRKFSLGKEQLIITDNGFITYFNNDDRVIWPNLTKEQAEREALSFMKTHKCMPENAVLNRVTYDDKSKGYLLEYVDYYDGFFIQNSYATVFVTPAGIKSYYQCWLEPLGYVGKRQSVISPLTAIMRVISEANAEYPIVITRIEQGYYSKLYDADRWQLAPVWKIQLGNEDTYYVNAYTGEMEQ